MTARLLGGVLALAALVAGRPLRAQDAVVRGRVLHDETGAPVADADVTTRAAARGAVTDADGHFEVRAVRPGTVELVVRRVGFAPGVQRFRVREGEVREVEVRLVPAAAQLDPVVATAVGDRRSLVDAPAAVAVADSVALRAGRTSGLNEALRLVPGVQANARFGTDDVNLSVRGASARARLGTRGVGVLLDGVPLSEPDGVTRFDMVELAAVRQVEVVRGPALALYPAQSAGVVNIISRTGADVRGASVRAQRGGFGFEKFDGIAGDVIAGGRGSVMAAGSYTFADGYRQHSQSRMLRGIVGADLRVGARGRVAFEASGSRLDSDWPGAQTLAEFQENPDSANPAAVASGFGRDDDRYRVGLRMEQGIFDAGLVGGFLYYGGRAFTLPGVDQVTAPNFHRLQGGVRVRSGFAGGAPVDVTLGADFDGFAGDDYRRTPRTAPVDTLLRQAELAVPSIAFHAQTAWRVTSAVELTAGVRYDEVRYRSEAIKPPREPLERVIGQLSPKFILAWRPGTRTSFYASVARGFEPLIVAEVNPGVGLPLNDSIPPKSSWNYEVGGRGMLWDRVLVDAAVFLQDVRNDFVLATSDGQQLVQSASRTRNVGVELGVTALVTPWLDASLAYTYTDYRYGDFEGLVVTETGARVPVDFEGNRFPGVPAHRIATELRVRPTRALSALAQLEWQDVMFVDNGNTESGVLYVRQAPGAPPRAVPFRSVPARALVNLQATWQLGAVALFGSVENLFDTRYVANVVVNDAQGRFYESGPGTWLTVGASVAMRSP